MLGNKESKFAKIYLSELRLEQAYIIDQWFLTFSVHGTFRI